LKKEKLTYSFLLQYGFLAAPIAFAGFPLYVLAPDFYATEYGVALSELGIALLVLRLFDAFQDPFIGFISDQYTNYTAFIMTSSAFILVLSIYGLFTLSLFSPLIWFVICMGLAVTAYSVLSINLTAIGALCTQEKKAQTSISAVREAIGLFGLILAVSLPRHLSNYVPKDQIYHWFVLILTLIMAIALLIFLRWHYFRNKTKNKKMAPSSLIECIKSLSLDSRKLLLVYLVSMIASSIPAVLVIFFVRDLLQEEAYTGVFLLLYFLSGACFMTLWRIVSQRYGKYYSWFFAMLLASVTFIWAFFLKQGDLWQYGAICIASGSALGADLVFPPAILADNLHASNTESNASTHYALLTLTSKVSLALAAALSLPMLESFGFVPDDAQNSVSALKGLSASYALIPCILKCLSAFLLWRMFIYSQNRKTL
jgi:glycoside/pentoside/hexuronide:cation symporter, GPH family